MKILKQFLVSESIFAEDDAFDKEDLKNDKQKTIESITDERKVNDNDLIDNQNTDHEAFNDSFDELMESEDLLESLAMIEKSKPSKEPSENDQVSKDLHSKEMIGEKNDCSNHSPIGLHTSVKEFMKNDLDQNDLDPVVDISNETESLARDKKKIEKNILIVVAEVHLPPNEIVLENNTYEKDASKKHFDRNDTFENHQTCQDSKKKDEAFIEHDSNQMVGETDHSLNTNFESIPKNSYGIDG